MSTRGISHDNLICLNRGRDIIHQALWTLRLTHMAANNLCESFERDALQVGMDAVEELIETAQELLLAIADGTLDFASEGGKS